MSLPFPVPDDDLLNCAPDLFSRHYRVYAAIEQVRAAGERFSILDVGGRAGLTKRFFPADDVTIVDIRADQEDVVEVAPGDRLPFDDGAFDFVVSFDVLEHVEPRYRAIWLAEVVRVAERASYVTVPDQNDAAHVAERRANQLFQQISGEPHPWLQEHDEFGIPSRDSIAAALDATGVTWKRFSSNPVDTWLQTISIGFVRDYARDIVPEPRSVIDVNQSFLDGDGAEPGYRAIYVACTADARNLDSLETQSEQAPAPAALELGLRDLHLIERTLRTERDEARSSIAHVTAQRDAIEQARAGLQKGNDQLRATIDELQQASNELRTTLVDRQSQLDEIHASLSYRVASRFRRSSPTSP